MPGKRILVVDDEQFNLDIISEVLEDEGFEVMTATNGQEALSLLNGPDASFHLMLFDWMMPVMDGIELLARVKSDSRFKDVPVIMLTAKAYPEDIKRGYETGVTLYVTKPFDNEVLVSMVKRTLEQFGQFEDRIKSAQNEKELLKGFAKSMLKRNEGMSFDLMTYKLFNEFHSKSLSCENHQDLAGLLLEVIKQLTFDSAGDTQDRKRLRCSLMVAGIQEVQATDRGLDCKLDAMILKMAMESKDIIQKGTYTAFTGLERRVALLVRNTPTDKKEAAEAINILSILLNRFEERLVHLEAQMAVLNQLKELEKKNEQIKRIIHSSCEELNKINSNYQELKIGQMELMEANALELLATAAELQLSEEQLAALRAHLDKQMLRSMDLYSQESLTDQKFLLTLQKLDGLVTEPGEESDRLTPGQLGGTSQTEVDDLLSSLGL